MKLLGVTGGIGMGKTAIGHLLTEFGAKVIDTDVIARAIVEFGQPALDEIKSAFGGEVFGSDGRLNRDKLAHRIFSDPEQRRRLEAILHPRIRRVWMAQAESWRKEGDSMGVVVIPLLFETEAVSFFEATLCVACTRQSQLERLKERAWNETEIARRIQAQWPIEKKVALADFVIWSEGGLDIAKEQLRNVLAAL